MIWINNMPLFTKSLPKLRQSNNKNSEWSNNKYNWASYTSIFNITTDNNTIMKNDKSNLGTNITFSDIKASKKRTSTSLYTNLNALAKK